MVVMFSEKLSVSAKGKSFLLFFGPCCQHLLIVNLFGNDWFHFHFSVIDGLKADQSELS